MKKQANVLQFKVIIEQDEDDWFVASAPAVFSWSHFLFAKNYFYDMLKLR